jgi:putative chitinase
MKGWPSIILKAFAADYNAYVEPLRDGDSAAFTSTNSVATSNHLNGSGMDLNWDGPPEAKVFRYGISMERAYPGAKAQAVRDLLAFYEDMVYCGGFWSIRDWMHFQMGYNTWNNPKTADFIARKIRADGFSTYKRGNGPPIVHPPPANSVNRADILARAAGISFTKAQEILPQVSFALTKANCNTPRRVAAALAQWIVESGHFVYTEEIASGPESEERWKYKGRTWIQLTWLDNYRGFGQWCKQIGLVDDPEVFVKNPKSLAEKKWAALGPAYWWAIKYPKINEYADRGDIDNVSKWVNAPAWVDNPNKHANGEKERRDAYNKALALGDQLLALTTGASGEDELSEEAERKIDVIFQEVTKRFVSRSPFRPFDAQPSDTLAGNVLFADGNSHWQAVKWAAELGHPASLELLDYIARGDADKYPDRADDILLAQAILAEIQDKNASPAAALQTVALQAETVPAPAYVQPEVVYTPAPAPTYGSTKGAVLGRAYDALADLLETDDLTESEKVTLNALIASLKTKTSQGEK